MLYVEGQELKDQVLWLYRHLEYLLNQPVERRLKSIKPAVISTELHFDKNRPIRKGYAGVHVSDGPISLIHVPRATLRQTGPAIVAHELVHAIGGNELDAEVAEALICLRTRHDPIITPGELAQFRQNPRGKYYTLELDGNKYKYRGIVLPW
jgi:hypothetical protein